MAGKRKTSGSTSTNHPAKRLASTVGVRSPSASPWRIDRETSRPTFFLPKLARPAKFWAGASLRFRVLELTKVLTDGLLGRKPFETLAIIADTHNVVVEAQSAVDTNDHQNPVLKNDVAHLTILLDSVKASYFNNISSAFAVLADASPGQDVGLIVLEDWMVGLADYFQLIKAVSTELGLGDVWAAAFEKVREHYNAISATIPQGAHGLFGRVSTDLLRVIPSSQEVSNIEGCLALGSSLGDDQTLRAITQYYRYWCQKGQIRGSSTIFTDIDLICQRIGNVLVAGHEIQRETALLYKGWLERFQSLWSAPAMTALSDRFTLLKVELQETSPPLKLESTFNKLALDLEALAPKAPRGVTELLWRNNTPILSGDDFMGHAAANITALYGEFQTKAYNVHEMSSLWLLIWRGLKIAFHSLHKQSTPLYLNDYPVENTFFAKAQVIAAMMDLWTRVEAGQTTQIEDIVGLYCLHVAECRNNPHGDYWRLRLLKASPFAPRIREKFEECLRHQSMDENSIAMVHKAVIRLNKLTGTPTVMKRLVCTPGSFPMWTFIPITQNGGDTKSILAHQAGLFSKLQHDDLGLDELFNSASSTCIPPENLQNHGKRNVHAVAEKLISENSNHSEIDHDSEKLDSRNSTSASPRSLAGSNRSFCPPECSHIRSAFDYVHCPFAETRANEVAQSEQITREMREPGILSQGPNTQWIINTPPRHARPSKDLSPYPMFRSTGPIGIIMALARAALSSSRARGSTQPAPRKTLSSRAQLRKKASALAPVHDATRRLTNQNVLPKMPKLRGGGDRQRSPHDDTSQNTQASEPQGRPVDHQQALLAALRARLPSAENRLLGDDYLVNQGLRPVNWDLTAAESRITSLSSDARRRINQSAIHQDPRTSPTPAPRPRRVNAPLSGIADTGGGTLGPQLVQDSAAGRTVNLDLLQALVEEVLSSPGLRDPVADAADPNRVPPSQRPGGLFDAPIGTGNVREAGRIPPPSAPTAQPHVSQSDPTVTRGLFQADPARTQAIGPPEAQLIGNGTCHPCPQFAGQYHHQCRCQQSLDSSTSSDARRTAEGLRESLHALHEALQNRALSTNSRGLHLLIRGIIRNSRQLQRLISPNEAVPQHHARGLPRQQDFGMPAAASGHTGPIHDLIHTLATVADTVLPVITEVNTGSRDLLQQAAREFDNAVTQLRTQFYTSDPLTRAPVPGINVDHSSNTSNDYTTEIAEMDAFSQRAVRYSNFVRLNLDDTSLPRTNHVEPNLRDLELAQAMLRGVVAALPPADDSGGRSNSRDSQRGHDDCDNSHALGNANGSPELGHNANANANASTAAAARGPAPCVPPTHDEYQAMFFIEMRGELEYRGVDVPRGNLTKKDLADLLVAADAAGNHGDGNRHSYRIREKQPHALKRPKNYKLPRRTPQKREEQEQEWEVRVEFERA